MTLPRSMPPKAITPEFDNFVKQVVGQHRRRQEEGWQVLPTHLHEARLFFGGDSDEIIETQVISLQTGKIKPTPTQTFLLTLSRNVNTSKITIVQIFQLCEYTRKLVDRTDVVTFDYLNDHAEWLWNEAI
jgi:hypothetical protein